MFFLCFHKLTTDLRRFAEELNLRAPIQVTCPIQHKDIQGSWIASKALLFKQIDINQVAYPTQTEHASLQSKKVTVKRAELSLPGSPKSFWQLVRVVVKQLVHPQPDGRGGAQQAPRLLHLPLQDFQDRQVAFKAALVTIVGVHPHLSNVLWFASLCDLNVSMNVLPYHMNFESAQCFVKCF